MIEKIPNVNFFCQTANLPGVSAGQALVTNPFRDYPIAGDKVQFNELRVRFIVDEELQNWLEIYNWIKGLTFPEKFEQYNELTKKEDGVYSEGQLVILTSSKNAQYVAKFSKMFPVDLTDIEMSTDVADVETVACDATFAYTTYTLERLIGTH
jgi:hypothetical protein